MPAMSSNWVPPGLETQPSYAGTSRLLVASTAFAFSIGVAWCHEQYGFIDLMTGRRSCGAAPRAIAQWSFTHHTRRTQERHELEEWVAQHGSSLNALYTAFCLTPLHIAARFGREDLAPVLLARGADPNARDGQGDRPLHLAADYGEPGVAAVLLQSGAEVDARGSGRRTALPAAGVGLAGSSEAPAVAWRLMPAPT